MIDIHTHLLPGIDDGPASLEESVSLARACATTGVTDAFVSPHVFHGQWNNKRSTILKEFELFKFALQRLAVPLRLHMAGEVRLNGDIIELLAEGELPYLGEYQGFKTMLLEMPDGSVPVGSDKLVRYLLDHKVRPVIVHPERNKGVMERPERIRPFVEMGCLLQLTAASLIGEFGPAALRASQQLLDQGWVDVVASDTHNLRSRPPRMNAARDALLKAYGKDVADELTLLGPSRITGLSARQSIAV